jgi:hypothetical protein
MIRAIEGLKTQEDAYPFLLWLKGKYVGLAMLIFETAHMVVI